MYSQTYSHSLALKLAFIVQTTSTSILVCSGATGRTEAYSLPEACYLVRAPFLLNSKRAVSVFLVLLRCLKTMPRCPLKTLVFLPEKKDEKRFPPQQSGYCETNKFCLYWTLYFSSLCFFMGVAWIMVLVLSHSLPSPAYDPFPLWADIFWDPRRHKDIVHRHWNDLIVPLGTADFRHTAAAACQSPSSTTIRQTSNGSHGGSRQSKYWLNSLCSSWNRFLWKFIHVMVQILKSCFPFFTSSKDRKLYRKLTTRSPAPVELPSPIQVCLEEISFWRKHFCGFVLRWAETIKLSTNIWRFP